jgi:hypothetical protein
MFIWSIADVIGITVITLLALCAAYVILIDWLKQLKCSHDGGVYETMACEAICEKCGKNLGSIGAWLAKKDNTNGYNT